MAITVNGTKQEIEGKSIALSALLKIHKVENPELVTIQHNGNFVEKADIASRVINENDNVDFLYFMGGGSHS